MSKIDPTGTRLKQILLESIEGLREGNMDIEVSNSMSRLIRDAVSITRTQLKIAKRLGKPLPESVIEFGK